MTLGAIAKNEGRYLPEWIAYHLAIGFDRIVVYSNDSEDNQNELLASIAKRDGRVAWMDWPSIAGGSAQISAYNDLLRWCSTQWIAFLDIDEFVVPLEDANIQQWLATIPTDVSTVHVNWRGFGSSGLTSPDYDLVTRAFEMAADRKWGNHYHFKSFGRAALAGEAHIHNIVAKSGRRTLSDFSEFQTINNGVANRVAYHRIQINHYQCKTYPEFAARMRGGRADMPIGRPERERDGSRTRFAQLDRNDEFDCSIRRFDALLDASLQKIGDLLAPSRKTSA